MTNQLVARRVLLPRLVRLRDAPFYLGMDRNRFNREVRPYLMVIPVGEQGIAFDRIDLDAWADEHKRRSGRPATWKRGATCLENQRLDSASAAASGTSTNGSRSYRAGDFERALARVVSNTPSDT